MCASRRSVPRRREGIRATNRTLVADIADTRLGTETACGQLRDGLGAAVAGEAGVDGERDLCVGVSREHCDLRSGEASRPARSASASPVSSRICSSAGEGGGRRKRLRTLMGGTPSPPAATMPRGSPTAARATCGPFHATRSQSSAANAAATSIGNDPVGLRRPFPSLSIQPRWIRSEKRPRPPARPRSTHFQGKGWWALPPPGGVASTRSGTERIGGNCGSRASRPASPLRVVPLSLS